MTDNDKGESQTTSDATTDFAKVMYDKQMEIFGLWSDMFKKNMPEPAAYNDMNDMVMKHVRKMSEKVQEVIPKDGKVASGPELKGTQEKLFLEFVNGYNEFLKDIMATDAFSSTVGAAMTRAMDEKTKMDDIRDKYARAVGIPTRTDIRDIHESIYFLNKRLDVLEHLLKEIRDGGQKKGRGDGK